MGWVERNGTGLNRMGLDGMGWDDWIALCCDAILCDWLGCGGIWLGWDRMAMAMMRCYAMRVVALPW